jgi:hypothetical protein
MSVVAVVICKCDLCVLYMYLYLNSVQRMCVLRYVYALTYRCVYVTLLYLCLCIIMVNNKNKYKIIFIVTRKAYITFSNILIVIRT